MVYGAKNHEVMMTGNTNPTALAERFPHLRREIDQLVATSPEFRQLSEDYDLLFRTISSQAITKVEDREEIIELKSSLELEVLDRISHLRLRA